MNKNPHNNSNPKKNSLRRQTPLISGANTRRLISVSLVLILVIVFGLTSDSFFTVRNISLLMRDAAYVGLISLGMAFVIIGGGIDLSAGGVICFSGLIAARIACVAGVPGIAAVLAGIMTGAACGLINALIITKWHLSDFVTTLASGFMFAGLSLLCTFRDNNGRVMQQAVQNKDFTVIGGAVNGLYFITIAWIVLMILTQVIMKNTSFGTNIYACGSNLKSSQMSGIKTDRMKIAKFVICGAFYGLAAVFTVAYQKTASLTLGGGMEFQAIAACVVGGLVLGGGYGDGISAFIGALFMTLLLNGLYKFGLTTIAQYIFQGGIIVLMIVFDAQFNRITLKRLITASAGTVKPHEQ